MRDLRILPTIRPRQNTMSLKSRPRQVDIQRQSQLKILFSLHNILLTLGDQNEEIQPDTENEQTYFWQ